MKNRPEIKETEIRVIGSSSSDIRRRFNGLWVSILVAIALILIGSTVWFIVDYNKDEQDFDDAQITYSIKVIPSPKTEAMRFTDVNEETINDVPMYLYTPNTANVTLQIGLPDSTDSDIIFVAQAADVRTDNGGIVGEFVVQGELLSKGVAKTGFCAIVDNRITIGVGKGTPLLQQAIENKGYFFRQYPLVDDGVMIGNAPKGKAIRRALAERRGEIVVVESRSTESFHDFAQALVDLECKNAIYLCGSTAYGWYRTADGSIKEFGIPNPKQPPMTSYIVWRK